MATQQQLVDRAERTAEELTAVARENFARAEDYARDAAAAAQEAADRYGARASETAHVAAERFGEQAQRTATTIRHEADDLRTEVEDLWEDPDSRHLMIAILAGVGLVTLALWLWRRRRRDDESYEASVTEVPGWESPDEALEDTPVD